MRRVNIKEILADPKKRRRLMALTLQATQAREGRDLTLEQAYAVVDKVQGSPLTGSRGPRSL